MSIEVLPLQASAATDDEASDGPVSKTERIVKINGKTLELILSISEEAVEPDQRLDFNRLRYKVGLLYRHMLADNLASALPSKSDTEERWPHISWPDAKGPDTQNAFVCSMGFRYQWVKVGKDWEIQKVEPTAKD